MANGLTLKSDYPLD